MSGLPWDGEKRQNYIRAEYIISYPVRKELRIFFIQQWNKRYQASFGSWDDTNVSGSQLFHLEQKRARPNKPMLQSKFKDGNTNKWDLIVLFDAILYSNSIGSSLNPMQKTEIDNLRKIRNELVHLPEKEVDDTYVQTMTTKVINALLALGLSSDEVVRIGNVYKPFRVLPLKPAHEVVSRSDKINEIREDVRKLRSDNDGKLTYFYISGDPGSGKSELARQVCDDICNETDERTFVMTLSGKDLDSLFLSYEDFCRRLNCNESALERVLSSSEPTDEKIKDLRSQISNRITKWKKWWIIIDNVENLELVFPLLPQINDKDWNNGQIILTTTDTGNVPADCSSTKHVSLNLGMNDQECHQFLPQLLLSKTDVNDPLLDIPKEIKWEKRSKKHKFALSKFVQMLKTEPEKVEQFGIYRTCFRDEFCIGEGSADTKVYVGLSNDGFEVAVKCMNLKKCHQMGENEKKYLNKENVRNEKHIVNYRFYEEIPPNKACLVLDLHEESLYDYVQDEKRPIEQLRIEGPNIIRQILCGICALHSNEDEILHRDLKPSNILVNVEGEMVLADFGICRELPKDKSSIMSVPRGTEGWIAAESLPTEDDDDYLSGNDVYVRYKKASDIQVLGMICYYILTKGKHPYGNSCFRNGRISKGEFQLKNLVDPFAEDLITWMLQRHPENRPSVHECLTHPYLRSNEENFKFVVEVGNENEIKKNDSTSAIVQELNNVPAMINWCAKVDPCVLNYMTRPRVRCSPYGKDPAHLLRFFRNMSVHWGDSPPPSNVQEVVNSPQEYFDRMFPTVTVELHRIIRKHPSWKSRDGLKFFF